MSKTSDENKSFSDESANGSLRSTPKSALLPILESFALTQHTSRTCDVYVIDGLALLPMLKPKGNVCTFRTFQEHIFENIVPYVTNKAAIYKRVDISCWMYISKVVSKVQLEKGEDVEVVWQLLTVHVFHQTGQSF